MFSTFCSGETEIIRHGLNPHHGRGLCGAGVPQEVDGYPWSRKGELTLAKAWENQSSASRLSVSSLLLHHLCFLLNVLASCLLHQVGCPAVLMLLLRHGAKVTATDGHGVTPLGIAAEYGNTEALEILIQHGKTLKYYVMLHICHASMLGNTTQRFFSLIRPCCVLPVLH